jgi:thiosulfate dehydrogenase [quinone] large subunit
MARATDAQLAYGLLRFALGVNLTFHGVNRMLGGICTFAGKTADDFAHTFLPRVLVYGFGASLPISELLLGLLLIAGAFTRLALVAGSLLMAALTFGTALRGEWSVAGTQLLYSLAYYVLLLKRSDDALSVDAWRTRRGSTV